MKYQVNDVINFDQFQNMILKVDSSLNSEEIKATFNKFDKDGNGIINCD